MEDFGRAVRGVRNALGLSQQQLADRLDVPQSYIAKVEAGADVRLSTARRIGNALALRLRLDGGALALLQNPPPGSVVEAARDFGVDFAALYENFRLSPTQRLDRFEQKSEALAAMVS